MKDPIMNDPKNKDMQMPFDMKRMAYGGFDTIVDYKS
jgi:alkaline phosphatase